MGVFPAGFCKLNLDDSKTVYSQRGEDDPAE